jgi:hypothetical protein
MGSCPTAVICIQCTIRQLHCDPFVFVCPTACSSSSLSETDPSSSSTGGGVTPGANVMIDSRYARAAYGLILPPQKQIRSRLSLLVGSKSIVANEITAYPPNFIRFTITCFSVNVCINHHAVLIIVEEWGVGIGVECSTLGKCFKYRFNYTKD